MIGYSKNVIGLEGKPNRDGDSPLHSVTFIDFVFCDEFKTYIASSKESIHRLVYIGIVNDEKKVIRKYPFHIYDRIYYHKTGFPEGPVNVVLNGDLPYVMTGYYGFDFYCFIDCRYFKRSSKTCKNRASRLSWNE